MRIRIKNFARYWNKKLFPSHEARFTNRLLENVEMPFIITKHVILDHILAQFVFRWILKSQHSAEFLQQMFAHHCFQLL